MLSYCRLALTMRTRGAATGGAGTACSVVGTTQISCAMTMSPAAIASGTARKHTAATAMGIAGR